MLKKNKRIFIILLSVVILLLIPLVAMQFSDDVKWTLQDFIIAGVLLTGTGLTCEFVLRKVKTRNYRIVICVVILIALLLIWVELAVGIFGTAIAGT